MDVSQIENLPALQPPPGVVPNYVDPWSIAPAGRIVIYVTLPLMLLVVASRLYVRWRLMGAHDYLSFAATAFTVTYCGLCLWLFYDSFMGTHQWNVRLVSITPTLVNAAIAATCLYGVAAMFIKISLLALYLSLFRVWRSAKILSWAGIVVITIFYLLCTITIAVFCSPKQRSDNADPLLLAQSEVNDRCSKPEGRISALQGVFSTLSDVYVLLLPMIFVPRLHLSLKCKIGVLAVFLVGFVATGCALSTTYYRFVQIETSDFTYLTSVEIFLGAAELNVAIICSSMPSTVIFYKRIAKSDAWCRLVSCIHKGYHTHRPDPHAAIA